MSGFFISFEGIDQSGKSTQAKKLFLYLLDSGHDVVLTYEPGNTNLGQEIRSLVLERKSQGVAIDATAEMFLFSADRAQHVNELIRPSLDAGKVVISDRYFDSTLAYQGYGRGLGLSDLRMIQNVATGGLKPDITVWIDVDSQTVQKRELPLFSDRIESKNREDEIFFQKVRGGFEAEWKSESHRIFKVDGERSVDAVFKDVKKVVINRIKAVNLYKIDLKDWLLSTIEKVERGENWNRAWKKTYFELGGKSKESGSKFSPMNGAEVLYRLGRIKNSEQPFQNPELKEIWNYSTNGVYAILALEYILGKPDISQSELWSRIQKRIRSELGEEPAKFNQGALTVAYKLWHLGLITHDK